LILRAARDEKADGRQFPSRLLRIEAKKIGHASQLIEH
jgi:hypothetical protein